MTPWVQLTAVGTWPHDGCVGGDVAIAKKGHLTLWLAVSGCQVGGGAKEGKKQWDFLFLKIRIQSTLSMLVPHSHWSNEGYYYGYYHKTGKKKWQVKQEIISNTAQRRAFFFVPQRGGEIFSGWQHLRVKRLNWCFYIHKDNPYGRNSYFRNLSCLQ